MTIFERLRKQELNKIEAYYDVHKDEYMETVNDLYAIGAQALLDEMQVQLGTKDKASVGNDEWQRFCRENVAYEVFVASMLGDEGCILPVPRKIEDCLSEIVTQENHNVYNTDYGVEAVMEQMLENVADNAWEIVAESDPARADRIWYRVKDVVRCLPRNGKAYELRMTKDGEVYADLDDDNALSLGSASGKDTWLGCVRMGESDE